MLLQIESGLASPFAVSIGRNGKLTGANVVGNANSHGVLSVITWQRQTLSGTVVLAFTVTSENIRKKG